MAKYQSKPTLESVAVRRNQTLAQLVADWGVTSLDELAKRCRREGVATPTNFTFAVSDVAKAQPKADVKAEEAKPIVKNALVELPKESEELFGKKVKKGKLTLDEPVASDEHVGVDQVSAPRPKNPA